MARPSAFSGKRRIASISQAPSSPAKTRSRFESPMRGKPDRRGPPTQCDQNLYVDLSEVLQSRLETRGRGPSRPSHDHSLHQELNNVYGDENQGGFTRRQQRRRSYARSVTKATFSRVRKIS